MKKYDDSILSKAVRRLLKKAPGLALVAATAVSSPPAAFAELRWEATHLDFTPSMADSQTVGYFRFQNHGKDPVKVTGLRPTCICCKAEAFPEQVKPGEKAYIKVTYEHGDHVGKQIKPVAVETNDPRCPVTMLTLTAFVPEAMKAEPKIVKWKLNGDAKQTHVRVELAKELLGRKIRAEAPDPHFSVGVKELSPGIFDVGITPKDVGNWRSTTLNIYPESPDLCAKITVIQLLIN